MNKPTAGALALLLWLPAACLAPAWTGSVAQRPALVIRQFPGGLELIRLPAAPDQRFALSFVHSVSGTPVRDEYRIEDGAIVQLAEIFETHGAGLPSNAEEAGAVAWSHEHGSFVLHMRRPIGRLVVRTDARYRNRLHLDGTTVDLNRWPDQALEVCIERDPQPQGSRQ
jgi:hypothetical protein